MVGPTVGHRLLALDPDGSPPAEALLPDPDVPTRMSGEPLSYPEESSARLPPNASKHRQIRSPAAKGVGSAGLRRARRPRMVYEATTVMFPSMNPKCAIDQGSHGARQFQMNVPVVLKYVKKVTLAPMPPSGESLAEGIGTLKPA